MSRSPDPPVSQADRDVLPPWFGGRWAIAFVVVSLVALAVVPSLLGRRVAEIQREITTVRQPARALGLRLSLIQARQMGRFQAFLLTGDRSFRIPYIAALAEEEALTDSLQTLAREMDLEVREQLADLSTLATRWHIQHQLAFDLELEEANPEELFQRENERYTEIQDATLELERSIQDAVVEGQGDMRRALDRQLWITVLLVLLALGSTLAMTMVGRHLRVLTGEAEQRRRDAVRARRELDALLEATGDGVLGIDLDGRCIFLNRAGRKLLGFSERAILGRDVHDTVHHTRPDGSPRPREESPILRLLRQGGTADDSDDVLFRRDGTSFPARWSLRPMVDGIDLTGAVLTFTDMTEIREKEAALEREVAIREEVLSIVSHDLRNPLGVISAAADLLLDLPLDRDQRRTQAEIISRTTDRMGRLIQDLLDVSRIEEGALVVRPSAEEPGALVEEVVTLFGGQAEEAGVTLEGDVDADLPRARADRDRIIQALSNLVSNALKFTPEGGRVRVGAHRAGPGEVALTVSDTGRGIAPDALERLFDRFWQADRHDRSGAGLGLAIVRGIAEAHGGRVEVASELGQGSTFTVVLPAAGGGEEEGRA